MHSVPHNQGMPVHSVPHNHARCQSCGQHVRPARPCPGLSAHCVPRVRFWGQGVQGILLYLDLGAALVMTVQSGQATLVSLSPPTHSSSSLGSQGARAAAWLQDSAARTNLKK
eukprot:scaffold50168_cov22-Tisochrysis_lutea.AAC.1